MTTTEKMYSVAEFMALPDNGKRYELVEGRLIEMPGPSQIHGEIITALGSLLYTHVRANKLGKVLSGTAFVLDPVNHPNNARIPDLAFVAAVRLAGTNEYDAVQFAPDLAIEVISPTDEWYKIVEKVAEYQSAGVRLVWLISPPDRTILIYRLGSTKHETLVRSDTLRGEDVVSGFRVDVGEIFGNAA